MEETFILRLMFDGHDSFYEVSRETLKELLSLPYDKYFDHVFSKGKPTAVYSSSDADLILLPEADVIEGDIEECKTRIVELLE